MRPTYGEHNKYQFELFWIECKSLIQDAAPMGGRVEPRATARSARMEVKAMTKLKTLLAAAAAVLVSFTASAEELAARTDRPVTPVSEILRSIETRPDYESQASLHYNPQ